MYRDPLPEFFSANPNPFQHSYDNSFVTLFRFHEYLAARSSLTEPDDPAFNPYVSRPD